MDVSESTANRFQRLWRCVERDLKWSQSELGRRLGMTPSAISFLASGRTNPSGRTLRALELLLEKEAPEILAEVEESLRNRTQAEPLSPTLSIASKGSSKGLDDEENRVDELKEQGADYGAKMAGLPEPQRKAVESLIDSLAVASQAAASELARQLLEQEERKKKGKKS